MQGHIHKRTHTSKTGKQQRAGMSFSMLDETQVGNENKSGMAGLILAKKQK
ncbi:MAG: hypothetical protein V9G25_03925 [Acidimicrobiia bacterium]